MKMMQAVACCLLAGAVVGDAQQMRQPVLGWIFDGRSGRIRAIAGVSGSAIVDEALPVESQFRFAAVAPGGGLAVGESDENTVLVRWGSGTAAVATLDDALRAIDVVVFSPSGRAAALRSGRQLQIWVGLRENPTRLTGMDDAAEVIAVSDEGALAMARDGVVTIWDTAGERSIYEGARVTALAFRAQSGDLAIADDQRGELHLAARGFTQLLTAVNRPASIAFSADGEILGVASAESAMLLNLRTGNTQSIDCSCAANAMERMQGNAVFRLGNTSKGAIRFLDGDALQPRVFITPQIGERQ